MLCDTGSATVDQTDLVAQVFPMIQVLLVKRL
jgi:hypothetical protein